MSDGTPSVAFLVCVEPGPLEQQAILFARALRRFGGRFGECDVHAYSPRESEPLPGATRDALAELDVAVHEEPLNREHAYYPFANKIYAGLEAERTLDAEVLVFCDTDTVFLAPPDVLELESGIDLAVAPAFLPNKASKGPGHRFEEYWRRVYDLTGVTDPPWTLTAEKEKRVRGYWNAGLLAVRRELGFHEEWLAILRLLFERRHFPGTLVVIDQIALAAAVSRRPDRYLDVPRTYNYNVARRPFYTQPLRSADLPELVQLHYHHWFNRKRFLADVRPRFDHGSEQYRWLDAELPLRPAFRAPLPGTKPGLLGRLRERRAERVRAPLRQVGDPFSAQAPTAKEEPERAPAPFVVGVPRSGTTLLRLMLDAHPQLAIPPETYFVTNLIEAAGWGAGPETIRDVLVEHRRWSDLGLDADELLQRLRNRAPLTAGDAVRTVFELYAERAGKPRWGDKTPAYLSKIARIGAAVPEARFVHLIRDGRAVALSVLAMPERDRPLGNPDSVAAVAKRWRRRIDRAREQGAELEHYLEIRYEDLVIDTEPTLRRVLDLCDLDWDPAVLAYHERAGERLDEMDRELPARGALPTQPVEGRLDPHTLVAEPPRADRAFGWRERMSAADREAFESIAGELLAELGYPVGDEVRDPIAAGAAEEGP